MERSFMRARRYAPTDPREWLNPAKSNLAQAKEPLPEVYLEDLCFNAQQAVEKAIKAVFLQHGLNFPHIHDLAQLLTGVGKGRCQNPKICTKRRGIDSF